MISATRVAFMRAVTEGNGTSGADGIESVDSGDPGELDGSFMKDPYETK